MQVFDKAHLTLIGNVASKRHSLRAELAYMPLVDLILTSCLVPFPALSSVFNVRSSSSQRVRIAQSPSMAPHNRGGRLKFNHGQKMAKIIKKNTPKNQLANCFHAISEILWYGNLYTFAFLLMGIF